MLWAVRDHLGQWAIFYGIPDICNLSKMPNTKLTLKTEDNSKINLQSSFGEYKIAGQNVNDFPSVPSLEKEENHFRESDKK